MTDDQKAYKIVSIEYRDKHPKKAVCKTVLTDINEIPFFHKFNFKKGTYQVKKKPGKKAAELLEEPV